MGRYDKVGTVCDRCHKPAKGFARINGKRYCHGDAQPSCYELQQHEDSVRMFESNRFMRWLLR